MRTGRAASSFIFATHLATRAIEPDQPVEGLDCDGASKTHYRAGCVRVENVARQRYRVIIKKNNNNNNNNIHISPTPQVGKESVSSCRIVRVVKSKANREPGGCVPDRFADVDRSCRFQLYSARWIIDGRLFCKAVTRDVGRQHSRRVDSVIGFFHPQTAIVCHQQTHRAIAPVREEELVIIDPQHAPHTKGCAS